MRPPPSSADGRRLVTGSRRTREGCTRRIMEEAGPHASRVSAVEPLRRGTFENWESEFLQMAAYLLLTVFLYQRGSAESQDPDAGKTRDPATRTNQDLPWPVRRGGVALLIQNSLSLAFLTLFLGSIGGHALA
jgi:hypothetical protein